MSKFMKIKKWLNQNGLVLTITFIVILIGGYTTQKMLYEIKKFDSTDIGKQPELTPIFICIVLLGVVCIVIEYCKRCKT